MEQQNDQTLVEPNTDDLETLEEEVKLMAEKIAEFRETLPEQLKDTLTSIISAHRPAHLTRLDNNDSGPGPSSCSHPDVRTPLDSEDAEHAEKVETIKQKISSNASAMALLVERMNACISRIDTLDSLNPDMIHPAFTRKRST